MKEIIKSTIVILITIALFSTAVYAWFSLSNESNLQEVNTEVVKRELNLDIEYGINGGGYNSFNEPATLNAYLSSMLPGDSINIRVIVENSNLIGDPDMSIDIVLDNIRAAQTDIEYDLTDFFYIDNGIVTLTWYASSQDFIDNTYYLEDDISLDVIDGTDIEYLGYNLEEYRINNLYDYYMDGENMIIDNNITVFESNIASQHILTIEFSISLDPYTPDEGTGFQDGELLIDGLYSLINEG
ncbi:hypothetical protein [Mariniplasma anaerobium]|uniref:Uncharacterized protein n=1 Tax=Mariniplasma anaerobium TaxID=2735436 RepID=A0A7U9XUQ0_9MOLU|nr:hypothetical protein [Mariniplasma anaerobium]BCR36240.1 hypothetical protein MPAN_011330 [Mariniplasma anaerobium]